jgi:hypothetical protein
MVYRTRKEQKRALILSKRFNKILYISVISGLLFSLLSLSYLVLTVGAQQQIADIGVRVAPMQKVEKTSDLNFGRFSPTSNGGSVIISTDGSRTIQGSITPMGGLLSAATFMVSGIFDTSFGITLPTGSITLTRQGYTASGSPGQDKRHQMTVTNFVSSPANNGVLDENGYAVLSVGATLTDIIKQQVEGLYIGSFDITITFE